MWLLKKIKPWQILGVTLAHAVFNFDKFNENSLTYYVVVITGIVGMVITLVLMEEEEEKNANTNKKLG